MESYDDVSVRPRLLLGVASVGWLAAMVLPLTTHGAGSSMTGHALADLASAGRLPDLPSWLGAAWYLVPLGGGVVLASLGLSGTAVTVVRWIAAAAAASAAVMFTVLVTDFEVGRFGAGTWTSVAGSALAAGAAAITVLPVRQNRRGDRVLH